MTSLVVGLLTSVPLIGVVAGRVAGHSLAAGDCRR